MVENEALDMENIHLNLRRADYRDIGFTYELMHCCLGSYFRRNTQEGWSRQKFREGYCPERIIIIEHEGMPIGFIDVEYRENEAFFHNFELAEDYRKGFLGIKLAKHFLERARLNGAERASAKVFTNNRCLILFRRLGFEITNMIEEENTFVISKVLES